MGTFQTTHLVIISWKSKSRLSRQFCECKSLRRQASQEKEAKA